MGDASVGDLGLASTRGTRDGRRRTVVDDALQALFAKCVKTVQEFRIRVFFETDRTKKLLVQLFQEMKSFLFVGRHYGIFKKMKIEFC